jgi:formate dehydrogenase iron-sulfur subunit
MNGCPVLAYEKDAKTGIVRHLDDQCIGCQYCVLKCPYEVPRYSSRLGIVRKCDMCANRLSVGEAPACVQSCPSAAIKITVVAKEVVSAGHTTSTENRVRCAPLMPKWFAQPIRIGLWCGCWS